MTPMMKQYWGIKENYPDAFLFFRLGDFYEMFFDDAIEAAKILEITLTARDKSAKNPVPMCGVPYHSASEYIKRLIEEGHKVAICEQLEDPKQAKGMVKRDVVKVITPGTILDEDALQSKENNYLVGIIVRNGIYHIAYIDISTGEINITQTDDFHLFISELQNIEPTELLYNETLTSSDEEQIKEQVRTHYTKYEANSIRSHSNNWQLDEASKGEQELLELLFSYLYSVQKQGLEHIKPIVRYQLSDYLQMNHYAKNQLELTRSLRTQRRKGSLLWLIDQTKTAMGGRLLHQWLDKPLLKMDVLSKRHQKVEKLIEHYFERLDLISALDNVYDLERLVTKISMGSANARDIVQLKHSLEQIPLLNQVLTAINEFDSSDNIYFRLLPTFDELYQLIHQAIVDDPPIGLSEGGIIKSGYHSQLDEYHDALENGQQWLQDLQQRERETTGLKTLKVGYNKVFGYFIEISRLQAQTLNDDRYIRKQTLTNSERYITDELKEIETTIIEAQDKAVNLEYQLFIELRERINQEIPALQSLAYQVAELDVLANFANISENEGYVRATLTTNQKEMYLEESRHPVVEKLIGASEFVSNDLSITPDQSLLLLTGPNMSGKSTYMRQIAFCVILNQIGCFVPAKRATLPLIDRIFTRIGSSDDISSGQSTFMVEMMETNYALEQATPRSLLLFDELGRGTATFDGMALAAAILFYIANTVKAATIFSTHYHELTALDHQIASLKNIHVGATEHHGELVFLHRIMDGPADKSYGIHVAKLAGLPDSLIKQSQEILELLEKEQKSDVFNSFEGQMELLSSTDFNDKESLVKEDIHIELNQTETEVLEELKTIDLNHQTPFEVMQEVYKLQGKLKEKE